MTGYFVTKQTYVGQRPDELTIDNDTSIIVHDAEGERVYCSLTNHSAAGWLPRFVLEKAGSENQQLNQSFDSMDINLVPVETDHHAQNQSEESMLLSFAAANSEIDQDQRPSIDEHQAPLESPDDIQVQYEFVEMQNRSQQEQGPRNETRDEVEPRDEVEEAPMSFSFAQAQNQEEQPAINILLQNRKRHLDASTNANETALQTGNLPIIVRFMQSKRQTEHGNKPIMVVKWKNKHYKCHWNSVGKKGNVTFRCYDCKAKSYMKVPETAVTFFRDLKDRKRFVIADQYKWDTNNLSIIEQDNHQCQGRDHDELQIVYESIISNAKIYIDSLKEPLRTVTDDVLRYSLQQIYTSMGNKTVERLFESNKGHQIHIRSINEKIDKLLKAKREIENSQSEDFTVYQDSLFELDVDYFYETGRRLFYNQKCLQFLNDPEVEVQIDGYGMNNSL